MKHRFLLHMMSHRILAVDITNVAPPAKPSGTYEKETVPLIWFQSWKDAESYFLFAGADQALLEQTRGFIRMTSTAILTIL
jgi:hypothetical protein